MAILCTVWVILVYEAGKPSTCYTKKTKKTVTRHQKQWRNPFHLNFKIGCNFATSNVGTKITCGPESCSSKLYLLHLLAWLKKIFFNNKFGIQNIMMSFFVALYSGCRGNEVSGLKYLNISELKFFIISDLKRTFVLPSVIFNHLK